MNKSVHIVSFSIPFPADYGGVIDVFYKIISLYEAGVDITLHCFKYDRVEAVELTKYCKEVFYYDRKMRGFQLLSKLPFIVSSRTSKQLLSNLLKDQRPILFEGLHSCALINNKHLVNREKIVRSHNIEHDYYNQLANIESNLLKRLYFKSEANKLKTFEKLAMNTALHILGISKKDSKYLDECYDKTIHVSAFHAYKSVIVPVKTEQFAFYHGNLGVSENNEAALFLVNQVFSKLDYPLVIAGNSPSEALIKSCRGNKNVKLESNISSSEIDILLSTAHINILPTFQSTGIKLKLLAALFRGNHCLVNHPMISGTGLERLVEIAETPEMFIQEIIRLQEIPTINSVSERESILAPFTNQVLVEKIIELL